MLIGVIGRRGRGKTTLAWWLVMRASARVVIDPRGLFRHLAGDHARTLAEVDAAMKALIRTGAGTVVISAPDDADACFDRVCRWLRVFVERQPGVRVALLADELRFLPVDDSRAFDWLARCAPQDDMQIVMTCHRPVDVPTKLRAILDHWCIFHITLPNDLNVIGDVCGPDIENYARTLGEHEWVDWDDGHGRATVYRDPAQWFVPLTTPHAAPVSTRHTSDRIFG